VPFRTDYWPGVTKPELYTGYEMIKSILSYQRPTKKIKILYSMKRAFKLSTILLFGSISAFSQSNTLVYNQTFAPSEGFVNRTEAAFRRKSV